MKILITGGAGFIASHIADVYIKDGHEVVVVDDLSSGKREFVNRKAKFIKADIRDKDRIRQIFQEEKPQVLNHHAAQISVRVSVEDPLLDAQVNLAGLLNLLEAGRESGIRKVIFASSGGVVYGEADKLPTPENTYPYNPLSPYGVSKLASEHYLNFYCQTYGLPFIALRYANVYGPRQNPHGEAGVVAIFTLKLLKGEQPVINGSGKQTRDYVFVKDVVEANCRALEYKKSGSFNIGTGKETNVVELFEVLRRVMGSAIRPLHGDAKKGEQQRSCLDAHFAQKELGWQAQTSLKEGFQKTVEYFKSNEKKSS